MGQIIEILIITLGALKRHWDIAEEQTLVEYFKVRNKSCHYQNSVSLHYVLTDFSINSELIHCDILGAWSSMLFSVVEQYFSLN